MDALSKVMTFSNGDAPRVEVLNIYLEIGINMSA